MNTVLLVEDDMGCRALVADMFEFDDIGADLICAATAEEALTLARRFRPILILMDIRLPGDDGLEATKSLKDDPRTEHIPIWAVTAYALTEDKDKALRAGCDDYITKPFDPTALKDRLRGFVSQHAEELVHAHADTTLGGAGPERAPGRPPPAAPR